MSAVEELIIPDTLTMIKFSALATVALQKFKKNKAPNVRLWQAVSVVSILVMFKFDGLYG